MNVLLKEHGYLRGEPGAYGLTEKGKRYAEEQHHDNGYGGYAYRGWETRTWNDDTEAALKADMASNSGGPSVEDVVPVVEDNEFASSRTSRTDGDVDDLARVLVVGVFLAGAFLAPHAKRAWDRVGKPTMGRLRDRLSTRSPDAAPTVDALEDRGES